jgi:transcriptional regulator NrdR family protein
MPYEINKEISGISKSCFGNHECGRDGIVLYTVDINDEVINKIAERIPSSMITRVVVKALRNSSSLISSISKQLGMH